MEENKPLYMPVRVQDSEDFISGIGRFEIIMIVLSTIVSIILGILIGILTNILIGTIVGILIIFLTVITVKRDIANENFIVRLLIIKKYINSKRRFLYGYYSIFNEQFEDK